MDYISFVESIGNDVLYSVILPGSGNIIGGKSVLIGNFESNIEKAFIKAVGMKLALGCNLRITNDWKCERPSTRIVSIAILRDCLLKDVKTQNCLIRLKRISMMLTLPLKFLLN